MRCKSPKYQWFVADAEFKPLKWHCTLHASKYINPIHRISLDRLEQLINSGVLRLVDVTPLLWYRRPRKVLKKRRTKFR